jgi:hypothetical protein
LSLAVLGRYPQKLAFRLSKLLVGGRRSPLLR